MAPLDAQSVEQPLTDCIQTGQRVGGVSVVGGGLSGVTFECPSLFEQTDTLLSGLFTLHLDVTAAMDGGQIFVEMQDSETNLRLGRATMDIRYYQGGSDPTTVLPRAEFDDADGVPSHRRLVARWSWHTPRPYRNR